MSRLDGASAAGADETCDAWFDAIATLDFARTPFDFRAMAAVWDSTFDGLLYLPQELAEPLRNWEEITDYWATWPAVMDGVFEWRELSRRLVLVGGVALVHSSLATSISIGDVAAPFDGMMRYTLGLRKAAAGWRVIYCHESRLVDRESVITGLTT
jgi:ketosteroid isomerase-like protein